LVDEGFRLGVESTRRFVENKNIRFLDQCSCDGDTLLLASRELCTSGASVCLKAVGLYSLARISHHGGSYVRNH
jgi:hypothetical protein